MLECAFEQRQQRKNKLTQTHRRSVTKQMEIQRKRKNMRNQALQCSQLLRPIILMYSCRQGEKRGRGIGDWKKRKEKKKFLSWRNRVNAPWASSPSPGPPPALCWGTCRWSWAPAGGAAGSGWRGWRGHTWRPGRGSETPPLWSSTARWLPRSCWASAWSLGPRRAARTGSPLGSSLQRARSN